MGLYTRPQLAVLLLLVGAAGIGLAVDRWRAAHPEIVERLERIDREEPSGAVAPVEPVTSGPSQVPPRPRLRQLGAEHPRRQRTERPPRAPRERSPRAAPAPPATRTTTTDDEPQRFLDLNRATLVELMRLPGVGPVLARRILDTREARGRFATVDDLATVRGLGRAKIERLRPLVAPLEGAEEEGALRAEPTEVVPEPTGGAPEVE